MDGMGRFPKAPAAGTRLGGSPAITSSTGYPWVDGDVLYAADLNAAFAEAFAADDIAGPAEAAALNSVGRNLIHNPLFNVAQRGVGPWTTNGYTLDRWILAGNTDTPSITQFAASDGDRSAIGDEQAGVFLSNNFTGNAAAGAFSEIQQRVENVRRLAGKTVTISFWAVASSALKLGINMSQLMGTGGSPSGGVNALVTGLSVTLSGTWTRYSVTITLPSLSGKTLGTNGDHSTSIRIGYSSGATNSAFFGNIGVQSGAVNIWGVQLEIGSVATPLEKPDPRYDLSNCQRFFCMTPVGNTVAGYAPGANQQAYLTISLPTTMRATPTVGANFSGGVNVTAGNGVTNIGTNSFQAYVTAAAAGAFSALYTVNSISADL